MNETKKLKDELAGAEESFDLSPEIAAKQKEFKKLKALVQRRYPNAKTVAKQLGETIYYNVVDCDGISIIDPELMLPRATSVRQAWLNAKLCRWFSGMIRKSNNAFNEEKIYKQLIKENGNNE